MARVKILGTQVEQRTLMSEELLMIAVLEQALADLRNGCPAVRADAEAYFFAYDPESSAFSFDAICTQFGLSQSAIRRTIRKGGPAPRLVLDKAA